MNDDRVSILENKVKELEAKLYDFYRPDHFRFQRPIKGGTAGLRLNTNRLEKLSFYDAAPVVQPATSGETSGTVSGVGTTLKHDDLHYGGGITAINATGYTINDIVKHLKNLGALKR